MFNSERGGAKSYLDGAVTSDVAGNGCTKLLREAAFVFAIKTQKV